MTKTHLQFMLFATTTVLTVGCASDPKPQAKGSLVADTVFFDPDGYYFPAQEVTIKGYKLEYFELHTLDYYYDGELHYQNPRLIPPEARLWLVQISSDSTLFLTSTQTLVSRDTIDIYCPTTPVGIIMIRGSFIDRRGQFWNKSDVTPNKKAVATARVFMEEQGKEVLLRTSKFTYWEGD